MASKNAQQNALIERPIALDAPRCPMCHRCPVKGVKISCGHVFCNICLIDLHLTAELVNGIAQCKACGSVLAVYEQHSPYKKENTITTVGELIAEAQSNPQGFNEWLLSSAIFQQQPQPAKVEQHAGNIQQRLQQASEEFRATQTSQIERRTTGLLARRRLSKDSSPLRLPMPQGQPLPRAIPLPNNMPLDSAVGDGFSNNLMSPSYFNLPFNRTDCYQGFGQLQPSGQTPHIAPTFSMPDIQFDALNDEMLFDSILETPGRAKPQDVNATKSRWEEKQTGVTQELEMLHAEAEVTECEVGAD